LLTWKSGWKKGKFNTWARQQRCKAQYEWFVFSAFLHIWIFHAILKVAFLHSYASLSLHVFIHLMCHNWTSWLASFTHSRIFLLRISHVTNNYHALVYISRLQQHLTARQVPHDFSYTDTRITLTDCRRRHVEVPVTNVPAQSTPPQNAPGRVDESWKAGSPVLDA
jgi:hypothetical protein